jgi:hypothetical protein
MTAMLAKLPYSYLSCSFVTNIPKISGHKHGAILKRLSFNEALAFS